MPAEVWWVAETGLVGRNAALADLYVLVRMSQLPFSLS